MDRQLTGNEEFAGMLATLVRQQCAAARSNKTSRSGLQASVPVKEFVYVRLGFDALVDLGLLRIDGDDNIGLTDKGQRFLAHLEGSAPADAEISATLQDVETDHRLQPPASHEEMRTLPGRLETYRAVKQPSLLNVWTVLVAAVLIAVVVVLLN